jgi:O-antigen/teichoic acid export membrane protein
MIRHIWRRLSPAQDNQSSQVGEEVRSDLGWHSLKANATSVLGARLLVPALNVVLVVAIARMGGAASLGQYTLLVTLFVLCENLKSLGLTTHMVREVARHDVSALVQYRSLVRIGIWGAFVTAPLIFLTAAHTNSSLRSLTLPALILCLGLLPSAYIFANDALFLGLGRAHLTLVVSLAENFLRLGASILAIFVWSGGLIALCAIYAGSRLFAALVQEFLIRWNIRLIFPPYQPATTRSMLRSAPAFATVFVMPLILFRMDVIFLGIMTSDYQVGVYTAAMRLVTVCLIVPDGVMTATFALLAKFAEERSGDDFKHLVERTLQFVTALLMPLTVGGALLAPFILRILYGPKFNAAIPIMQILVWALVPFGVNRALGDALVARGEQNIVARIVLTNVAVGALLYLTFIPMAGPTGAAWAFFCSVLGCSFISAIIAVYRAKIAGGFLVWTALLAAIMGSMGFAFAGSTLTRTIWSLVSFLMASAGIVRSYNSAPGWMGTAKQRVSESNLATRPSGL